MKSSFPIAACTPLDRYHDLVRIGQVAEPQTIRLTYVQGTYGTVYRAKDVKTGDLVALKRIIMVAMFAIIH